MTDEVTRIDGTNCLSGVGRNDCHAGNIHHEDHWKGKGLEIETFLGPEMHSWAMPDKSVTSGTGTLMPECRCRLRPLTTGRNADAGLTFF